MVSEETTIVLSPLDHIPPFNYVRLVFPIRLKPGVAEKVLFEDFQNALHKTFVQEPWLAGKVFRQPREAPSWRPGQLEVRYQPYLPDGPLPDQIRYLQLDTDWTYDEFREAGFPADVFPEELLLDAPQLGDVDGEGAPVFLAQINYLPGGVLLAMTTSHAALDGAGMMGVMQLWAKNFCELHSPEAGKPLAKPCLTSMANDRSLPERLWLRETGGREPKDPTDPWLRGLVGLDSDVSGTCEREGPRAGADPPRHPHVMINKVLFLSSVDLGALRKECAAEPLPPGAEPVSTGDCINALFWRGVMSARLAAVAAGGDPPLDAVSVFESPVDVRQAFAADLPPDYPGNFFLFNTARLPLAELVRPEVAASLGRIAQTLRRGAARLRSRDAIHDAYALLRAAPDLAAVEGRFVERAGSADLLLSNLIAFPLHAVGFGDAYFGNGGVPDGLRVLHAAYAPYVRLGHVLPKSEIHGGVELSVNLFDDEWEYLEKDPGFQRYLVPIESPR